MNYQEFCSLRTQFEETASKLTTAVAEHKKPAKANFPRGFIRPLNSYIFRWPYLTSERRRTVACVMQLCDVNRWNLNIWNIGLTAGTLVAWHAAIPVIAVIETLAYEVCVQSGWANERAKFEKCINLLNSKGIIKQKLRDDIDKLREYRNHIHLYLMEEVQTSGGSPKRYNEAVQCLNKLEEQILEYWKNKGEKF